MTCSCGIALESRFGTFEDSYHNLPGQLRLIEDRNPGTHVDIQDSTHPKWGNRRVLKRAFFVFGPCINAFRHCRPILCVDGTIQHKSSNSSGTTTSCPCSRFQRMRMPREELDCSRLSLLQSVSGLCTFQPGMCHPHTRLDGRTEMH